VSAEPAVLFETRGAVAIITMNRPESRNAIAAEMSEALGQALERLENDPTLMVGILTGAGTAFCAGADLKKMAEGESLISLKNPQWGFGGIIEHPISKPLIAAVNGPALAGGTEVMLCCDLVIMSKNATFGLPEVKRGLLAAAGGVLRLGGMIPPRIAMEIVLTGDPINAETADRWGLVNQVVEPEQLMESALALAERIAVNAPLSVQASRRVLLKAAGLQREDRPELWELNDAEWHRIFTSEDAKEGPRAFAEKRQAKWSGR
jgi:crotonobetainyl-CoA hydratase